MSNQSNENNSLHTKNALFILYIFVYFLGWFGVVYGFILDKLMLLNIGLFFLLISFFSSMFLNLHYIDKKIKFKGDHKKWLRQHINFIMVELFASMFIVFLLNIPLIVHLIDNNYFPIFDDINLRGTIMLFSLVPSTLMFGYLTQIENVYDMGYITRKKISYYGLSAYADLSHHLLVQNNKNGLKYLKTSLVMLFRILKDKKISYEKLSLIIMTLVYKDIFSTNNLEPHKELSYSLTEKKDISAHLESIDKFLSYKEFHKIHELERQRKENKILTLLKNPLIQLLLTMSAYNIPEEYKPELIKAIINTLGEGLLLIIFFLIIGNYLLEEYFRGLNLYIEKEHLDNYYKKSSD